MSTNQALVEAIYAGLFGGGAISSGLYGGTSTLLPTLRTTRAAVADAAGAWTTRFTIAGGVIGITGLIAIRTVAQGGAAATMQWRHSVGPTVMDNGTAVITGNGIGAIATLTGDVGDAIQIADLYAPVSASKVVATSATYGQGVLFYAGIGNIQVMMTATAGTSRFILTWVPVDAAATVVAV